MVIVWCSVSQCYFLIAYEIKYIRGNVFLNAIVSQSSEIFACAFSGVLIKIFDIKTTLLVGYVLAFLGMFLLIYYPNIDPMYYMIFILLSKFGISINFNLAFVGNQKYFPTLIVSSSFGVCAIISRLSTIVVPYLAELKPI